MCESKKTSSWQAGRRAAERNTVQGSGRKKADFVEGTVKALVQLIIYAMEIRRAILESCIMSHEKKETVSIAQHKPAEEPLRSKREV